MQIRTIAMDFWASLEHKIFYKFDKSVPEEMLKELKEAAESANALDQKMETLHNEINEIKRLDDEFTPTLFNEKNQINIPLKFLEMMNENSN